MPGVGTELKRLLEWFGQYPAGNCDCVKHADEMDVRGVAWCECNRGQICKWILEEAQSRGPAVSIAAAMTASAMVGQAIRNAKATELANNPGPSPNDQCQ